MAMVAVAASKNATTTATPFDFISAPRFLFRWPDSSLELHGFDAEVLAAVADATRSRRGEAQIDRVEAVRAPLLRAGAVRNIPPGAPRALPDVEDLHLGE